MVRNGLNGGPVIADVAVCPPLSGQRGVSHYPRRTIRMVFFMISLLSYITGLVR